jgi:hypothetical protein
MEHQYNISAFNTIKYYLVLKKLYIYIYIHILARAHTHARTHTTFRTMPLCFREQGKGTYSVSPVDKVIPNHLAMFNGYPILLQRQPNSVIYIFLFRPVVFNLFSSRTPRDTSPLNFVPPKLLVQDFIVE